LSGSSKVHKSARGSVYLQEVTDWSFEADHPALIEQATLISAIQGLVAEEVKRPSTKLPVGGSKPMRVFSDADAEFLAPLLAQGLSQAKPEQIVGFTVSPSAGSGDEPAAGTIYMSQNLLHLTIAPTKTRRASGFMPGAAARIEKVPSYAAEWAPGTLSMAIDPQALAKTQVPAAVPVASAPGPLPPLPALATPTAKPAFKQEVLAMPQTVAAGTPAAGGDPAASEMSNDELLNKKLDELRQARETNKMKDSEITMLRKEVEWMKQELRERTAELKAAKASAISGRPATKKKPAEAYRVR
jgi:hypothetical protein